MDRHTGMCKTLLSLDPLDDAKVWAAFHTALGVARAADQLGDDRTFAQMQTDAIVDHITRPGGGRWNGPAPAEVSVLIDVHSLIHATAPPGGAGVSETADGQVLPVEVIRRLGCDGVLVPVWLGGPGEVLAVGRERRLATRAQRRAWRAMYRTCAHPDCTVGFESCRIHHVVYWERFGLSDLDNMIPLCERHHHLVHEGGWSLQLFADRRTIWTTPQGTIYHHGISTTRTPALIAPVATFEATGAVMTFDRCRERRTTATVADERDSAVAESEQRGTGELDLAIGHLAGRSPP